MSETKSPRGKEKATGTNLSYCQQRNVAFPAISSILVTFPVVKGKRDEIRNTLKRKSILELDRYLQNNHQSVHQDFTRFIFANPLRNTIVLHKTLNSHFSETRKSKQSLNILEGNSIKKHNCFSHSPFKSRDEFQKFKQVKQQMFRQIKKAKIQQQAKDGMRIGKRTIVGGNNINGNMMRNARGQRYSPWRYQYLQDELII